MKKKYLFIDSLNNKVYLPLSAFENPDRYPMEFPDAMPPEIEEDVPENMPLTFISYSYH